MEAGLCRRQRVRPAPKYNIRPPGGTKVSEETVTLKTEQVGQEAQLWLCRALLGIPKLLPRPAWHLICGQRSSGALEPTLTFQSFNSTALTGLGA